MEEKKSSSSQDVDFFCFYLGADASLIAFFRGVLYNKCNVFVINKKELIEMISLFSVFEWKYGGDEPDDSKRPIVTKN